MKLIVAGGRFYRLTKEDYKDLQGLCKYLGVKEIVSGGAPGADSDAKVFAYNRGYLLTIKMADWASKGKAAGFIRNEDMAKYVGNQGACVVFPGGNGTDDMARIAKKYGLKLIDWRDRDPDYRDKEKAIKEERRKQRELKETARNAEDA